MLTAVDAVAGNNGSGLHISTMEQLLHKVSSLGIPHDQLQQMVAWMRGALGDPGLYVTPDQMEEWRRVWDSCFQSEGLLTTQNETAQLQSGANTMEHIPGSDQCDSEYEYQSQGEYEHGHLYDSREKPAMGIRAQ